MENDTATVRGGNTRERRIDSVYDLIHRGPVRYRAGDVDVNRFPAVHDKPYDGAVRQVDGSRKINLASDGRCSCIRPFHFVGSLTKQAGPDITLMTRQEIDPFVDSFSGSAEKQVNAVVRSDGCAGRVVDRPDDLG